jgi:hypothetical protein
MFTLVEILYIDLKIWIVVGFKMLLKIIRGDNIQERKTNKGKTRTSQPSNAFKQSNNPSYPIH